jgi:membrane protease YdiL (CAAX protease family)
MSFKSVFIGPKGLRAGWRFAAFTVLAIGIAQGFQVFTLQVLGYRPHRGLHPLDFLVADGLGFIAALIAAAILVRAARGERMRDYGLPLAGNSGGRWGEGFIWGLLAVGILVAAIALFGGYTLSGLSRTGGALAAALALWAATMVVLGFYEEYLFRGYPLKALASGMGFWPAAVLLSVMFGALHYFTKPMETIADALSVSLIGLFLCLSFRRTGSLWFAAGFHTAFDFAALPLFGAPNTANNGEPVPLRLLEGSFHGPAWLTGGPCGIEASLLIFPVIGLLFLLFDRRFRAVRWPAGETK